MVSVTTGVVALGVTTEEITGMRLPIRIFAFSRLRTRTRGLDSRLLSPASLFRLSCPGPPGAEIPRVLSWNCVGKVTPSSFRRERSISSTSISSTTSGSAWSCTEMRFSARRITSGVSRMTSRLSFSSMKVSLVLSMVLIMFCVCFTSAFSR